jgi:hypothetical protein
MDIKKKILALSVMIIFALFVGYGIEVFNPTPESRDIYSAHTLDECVAAGGEWREDRVPKRVVVENESDELLGESYGYCSTSNEFENLREGKAKIVFIASLIIGILAVIVASFLKVNSISAGILGGGVLTILYGTIRYWQYAQNTLKFVLLGLALGVLIYLGYKKIK